MWSQSVHFPDRRNCPLITNRVKKRFQETLFLKEHRVLPAPSPSLEHPPQLAFGRIHAPPWFSHDPAWRREHTWSAFVSPPQLSTDTTTQQHPLSVFPELNVISHWFLFCSSTMDGRSDAWVPVSHGKPETERVSLSQAGRSQEGSRTGIPGGASLLPAPRGSPVPASWAPGSACGSRRTVRVVRG